MPDYTLGAPHPATKPFATFEFKQSHPDHTGGGYPRWRSTEWRPETASKEKEDVYVAVHRLAAVAWLLPGGTLGDDVRLADLDGFDVHHELGMPAANLEDELTLVDHGGHSEITQEQVRAWAEDDRRRAFDDDGRDADRCDRCGEESDTLATSAAFRGESRCLECAMATSDGEAIEL